jgi:hypothetical protein
VAVRRALLLTACGRTDTLILTTSSDAGAPFDCRATCERLRPQLIRDFAIRPEGIDCSRFPTGVDCPTCSREFERLFTVRTACQ